MIFYNKSSKEFQKLKLLIKMYLKGQNIVDLCLGVIWDAFFALHIDHAHIQSFQFRLVLQFLQRIITICVIRFSVISPHRLNFFLPGSPFKRGCYCSLTRIAVSHILLCAMQRRKMVCKSSSFSTFAKVLDILVSLLSRKQFEKSLFCSAFSSTWR